jgi:hypothetical protein
LLALATLAQGLGTNWGLSLGLEELDISGNDGESASAVWGQYVYIIYNNLLVC